MAAKEAKPKKRVLKQPTVREKAEKQQQAKPAKRGKARQVLSVGAKPFKAAHRVGKSEYYLPMPSNRLGKFLNKRRSIIPSYFRNSFKELKQVIWPSRRETTQLTLAVFVFALIFGLIITITDFGLDKLFKKVLLK